MLSILYIDCETRIQLYLQNFYYSKHVFNFICKTSIIDCKTRLNVIPDVGFSLTHKSLLLTQHPTFPKSSSPKTCTLYSFGISFENTVSVWETSMSQLSGDTSSTSKHIRTPRIQFTHNTYKLYSLSWNRRHVTCPLRPIIRDFCTSLSFIKITLSLIY